MAFMLGHFERFPETPARMPVDFDNECEERKPPMRKFTSLTKLLVCMASALLIAGCATSQPSEAPDAEVEILTMPFKGLAAEKKDIFVFFDGTANTPDSETNVWRLYEEILKDDAPQKVTTYLVGVGSPDDQPLLGMALGKGMEKRILAGYEHLIRNYRAEVRDNIYIFGFSRGAHQARALAGLVAYAGIPSFPVMNEQDLRKATNSIIEHVKKKSDDDYVEHWKIWNPESKPVLAEDIRAKLGFKMSSAQVNFLGVWDTVPGSSLKDYGTCKEKKGFVKRYLYWLIPGVDKGERYKSDSYPPIRRIVHAVSVDEKRSKFAPLLICDPINPEYTDKTEVWFPGAHADVGGGYKKQFELPDISLGWMINHLSKTYEFQNPVTFFEGNPKGLAHWSIGDSPANIGSVCEDREPPVNAAMHNAVQVRKNAGNVRIRKEMDNVKVIVEEDYPIDCPE